jgi:hypothetical protein
VIQENADFFSFETQADMGTGGGWMGPDAQQDFGNRKAILIFVTPFG